ncbi:hypothetical protein Q0590_25375 [Rhodocytophaga aerolata]|uniref:Uncharacterized protein n=1 Tax=Rhodocytophaga aerolata TaxID=455078 RepID=A0ABT8RE63_9BACT|nr:hypothetical protein [Rhodocytophaga aerolata]MDO1449634.1 hypothetical protein [Rhodocytophaga aerolata]
MNNSQPERQLEEELLNRLMTFRPENEDIFEMFSEVKASEVEDIETEQENLSILKDTMLQVLEQCAKFPHFNDLVDRIKE